MIIIKPALLVGREYFYFSFFIFSILLISLSLEYYHYSKLTQFDDAIVEVAVIKHYSKSQGGKTYDVLKLQTDDGAKFYITTKAPLKHLVGYKATLWVLTKYISFFEYIKGFATKGAVISVTRSKAQTYALGDELRRLHTNQDVAQIYGALFFALPLSSPLQEKFSMLGVSHLLAISGFHLGVLSYLLFSLLRLPYTKIQKCYFPHRHANRDLFIVVAVLLGMYLLFLGDVASLLRAYTMLIVGYILHDRGLKIVSIQTLLFTAIVLLALWPKLLFSLGFWLSIGGVYFIFLYFHYFTKVSAKISFIGIAVWVYLLMTPVSLVLFGNYSLYHPLSILWSLLFTVFYPLSLLLHALGFGALLDGVLVFGLSTDLQGSKMIVEKGWLLFYLLLSVGAYFSKWLLSMLFFVALGVSIAAVYQVT